MGSQNIHIQNCSSSVSLKDVLRHIERKQDSQRRSTLTNN